MKLSLTQKVLLVVAIPLACQLAFLGVMSQKLDSLTAAQVTEQHFAKVMMARDHLLIDQHQKHLLFGVFWATQDASCPRRIDEVRADYQTIWTN